MAKVDTMPIYLRPIMRGCSVKLNRRAVCGATYPLNQHHIVRRSAGKMYDCHGVELPKPTITLCGNSHIHETEATSREAATSWARANGLEVQRVYDALQIRNLRYLG